MLKRISKMHILKRQLGLGVLVTLSACGGNSGDLAAQAEVIVSQMSLHEKVGQKIMMAFRYWCDESQPGCTTGMVQYNDAIGTAIAANKIGGVILFANNLTDLAQTAELTGKLKRAAAKNGPLGLFIAIDQEGGNVARLPRNISTTFPGNMALGAAYQATQDAQLAYQQGKVLAAEIKSVGFNLNFAPVIDVNSNPLNPVINVRSFGDDPQMIGILGNQMALGMSDQGVVGTLKHFPGHGDTATDSHYGLPIVNKSREEAYAIDLAPYRSAIKTDNAPGMIMTAHIQYPALDNSTMLTKTQEKMIAPATLSRKIQHDILRTEFGYQGVTITDALDMKSMADFFEQSDVVIKTFQAGVDIALMPTEFRTASNAHRLSSLIDTVVTAVESGTLRKDEIDQSVKRIVLLKLRQGIVNDATQKSSNAASRHNDVGSPEHKAIEADIVKKSITLIKNDRATLPLKLTSEKIHILTPWGEQAEAMRRRFNEFGHHAVTGVKLSDTTLAEQQAAIDGTDILIIGTSSTAPTPVEINGDPNIPRVSTKIASRFQTAIEAGYNSLVFNVEEDHPPATDSARSFNTQSNVSAVITEAQFMRYAMEYAKKQNKKIIHVTLRAPYDVVNYDDLADATLATYSYYGYENYLRGPSLPVAVDVMLGRTQAVGKLPVNIRDQNADGSLGNLRYPRGFGLMSEAAMR